MANGYYKTKNGLALFAGFIVETDSTTDGWANVSTIIDPNMAVGDRLLRFPIPGGALRVSLEYLEETADPNVEFSTRSPFGKYQYEGTYAKDGLRIAYTVFEDALSVSIIEGDEKKQRTLYSQNFFAGRQKAADRIQELLSGKVDPEDLIFALDSITEQEG